MTCKKIWLANSSGVNVTTAMNFIKNEVTPPLMTVKEYCSLEEMVTKHLNVQPDDLSMPVDKTSNSVNKLRFRSSLSFLKSIINEVVADLIGNYQFPESKSVDIFIILSELLVFAVENSRSIYDHRIGVNYIVIDNQVYFSIEPEDVKVNFKEYLENNNSQGLILVKMLSEELCWNKENNKVFVKYKF